MNALNLKRFLRIVLLLLLLIFNPLIVGWHDSIIVTPFLSKIEGGFWSFSCLILLAITVIVFTIKIIRDEYKVHSQIVVTAVLSLMFYCYYRFFTNHYNLTYWDKLPSLKYSDIAILFCLMGILPKIILLFAKPAELHYKSNPFLIDSPIFSDGEDQFERKDFAKLMAEKIQSKLDGDKVGSLALGINGEWGAGKTSFCNLIRQQIEKERRIIIDFNPWRSASSNKIIEDFFELLISSLEKYDAGLSKNLSYYAKTLTKIDENVISKSIETISDYFFETPDKNENYDRINESIRKIKMQIIIFIDDLDRLDKKEIIEVLRLIRNTASFSNVVYLVAYDKSYIQEAIKDFNPHNYRYFLEKIFQFEFLLPTCNPAILRTQMKKIISEVFPDRKHIIEQAIDYQGPNGKSLTSRVVRTQRDIIRICNSLFFEIEKVKDDVNFIDFYFVQLMKVKFSGVYKFISDNRDLIFVREEQKQRLRAPDEKYLNVDSLAILMMRDNNSKAKDEEGKKDAFKTVFEAYIKTNTSEHLSELDQEFLIDLIQAIMQEKQFMANMESRDAKSFLNYNNFDLYFNIQSLGTTFPVAKLERARLSSFDEYRAAISELIENGQLSEVIDYLEKIVDFFDFSDWGMHLKILLDIERYQMEKKGPGGLFYTQIIRVLNYPCSKNSLLFFVDKEKYKEYIKAIFTNAEKPAILEGSILAATLMRHANLEAISPEEIEDILFGYFEDYCETHNEITPEFEMLYRNCVKPNTPGEIQERAQSLFIKYYKENLTAKKLNIFVHHVSFDNDLFDLSMAWVNFLFTNLNDFEFYLNNAGNLQNNPVCLEEFKSFYNSLKNNNYLPILFNFECLEPDRIRRVF